MENLFFLDSNSYNVVLPHDLSITQCDETLAMFNMDDVIFLCI